MTQPHRNAVFATIAFSDAFERWQADKTDADEALIMRFYNEQLTDENRQDIAGIVNLINEHPTVEQFQEREVRDKKHSVCRRCKTVLAPGKALVNTLAGLPDFPGDNSPVTLSPTGRAVLTDCQKCPNCGQSYTS